MNKYFLVTGIVFITVIGINAWLLNRFKINQIKYQKQLVLNQTSNLGIRIEQYISGYQNDLTKILFTNKDLLSEIFTSEKALNTITGDLRNFYSEYRDLVSNIAIYDNENKYLGIYIKENDEFVLDTFPRQRFNNLYKRDIIIKRKACYLSYFPYFRNNELFGNVEVEVDILRFLKKDLMSQMIDQVQWQWLVDNNGQIIFSNRPDSIIINELDVISDAIINENELIIEHSYSNASDRQFRIISGICPLNILNKDLGLVFSLEASRIFQYFNIKNQRILLITILLFSGLVFWLIYEIYRTLKNRLKKDTEMLSLKMVLEQFPVGMMVLDSLGKIKYINKTGQKMLFINRNEEFIGKTLSGQLMIPNKYLLKEEYSTNFDSNQFIHYEKNGNETVIYRKDVNTHIAGESIVISALIDVSALEKSRKQEAAANMAKSDFLAKMSHEIRNPMNAMIAISDNLLNEDIGSSEKEKIKLLKDSTELLLNYLNDILDFSKIEAGKLMLEEIPFILSKEISLSLELLKSLAAEKDLQIKVAIGKDIPDSLIGDPFRLRQVISNLVSNAIKFTQKGLIKIEISLIEKRDTLLNLLFSVADTGIGIPENQIERIFASYEQGEDSVSRKYGGTGLGTTIAKQLVELMNGEIWVQSPSEISDDPACPGTKFSFSVEVHSNELPGKKIDLSSINKFQQVSVLILNKIKDEYDTVHHLFDQLGINFNYRVYEDSEIENTVFYIEQNKDRYHVLVIMDKLHHSGFEIARKLKNSGLSEFFPIIMVSSNNQPGNYKKCRRLGVDYYLIQPYESAELFKILKSVFTGLKETGVQENMMNKIRPDLKILYADDNILNQRVSRSILKNLGYEADLASNGIEALELVNRNKYDIIFMDILMPEMDGIKATREIRNLLKSPVPIIGIGTGDNYYKREDAIKAGMDDFIIKPIKVEIVKQLLIKWLC